MWNAFRQGLRDLGYLEGQNIAFEYRTADGVPVRLAEAATDLARRPVDVIATYGTPASVAAKAATTTIPIVMIGVGDVVRTGLVQGLAHPGGNITGNTILGVEMQSKRLQLFKEVAPARSLRIVPLSRPAGSLLTGLIASSSTGPRRATSIASSKARNRPICRCRHRPSTSWSSI